MFGEGEWKTRKHGSEKRRTWRKLHLAIDASTHEVVAAEVSLVSVGDNEVLPTLLNPLRRKIAQVSADGAYDTKGCCDVKAAKLPSHRAQMRGYGKRGIHAMKR